MVRSILTTIIMATASVFSMVSCATEPVQKEIGLQLYSIRDQINEDLDTSLDAVAQAGYTFVEMAGYNAQEGTFYGMSGEAFKELCNAKGLDSDIFSHQRTGPKCHSVGRMYGMVG